MDIYDEGNMGEYYSKKLHILYDYLERLKSNGTITEQDFRSNVGDPLKKLFEEEFPMFSDELLKPTKGTELQLTKDDMVYQLHLN